jgi:hypothetical protein
MANKITIESQLVDFDTLLEKIEAGEFLVIAADESILQKLPAGNWIAGTIPYFMTEQGGLVSQSDIFVNTIGGVSANAQPRITPYDVNSIARIAQDAPDNGFTIVILPAGSDVHGQYAENAPGYANMFFSPIVGWIAGTHLSSVGSSVAKTGFGPGSMLMADKAVAMHVALPENQIANIHIVNLFEQGAGAKISFPQTGFKVGSCLIDGVESNFAEYIAKNNIDTRLPLVADYNGINVNVSVQRVNGHDVDLYAPVFSGIAYQFAAPVTDYVSTFNDAVSGSTSDKAAFSCNCILNFMYSELEGKKTGNLTGPITFGEVAYQLLNQTLVYMTLENQ